MLELFEHNRIAYESALSMLKENGRAAIVHPTGKILYRLQTVRG